MFWLRGLGIMCPRRCKGFFNFGMNVPFQLPAFRLEGCRKSDFYLLLFRLLSTALQELEENATEITGSSFTSKRHCLRTWVLLMGVLLGM